jgi:hypothetical protein
MISCIKSDKTNLVGSLLKTDMTFSKMSERVGMHNAFIAYISDDGVLLRDNVYPLKGENALIELFAKNDDSGFTLIWEPLFERLSSGGDIGYTYGTYVTIWQKGKDGNWKFVLDSGTQGLPDMPE